MTAAAVASPVERRATLAAQLDALRVARGEAVLDGGCFDNAKIVAIETELCALDDAEAAQTRRQRTAAERAEAKRIATIKAAITDRNAKRMKALAAAEAACIAMTKQLSVFLADGGKLRALARELADDIPLSLDLNEIERRIGRMIAGALGSVKPGAHALGGLHWNSVPFGFDDWCAAEIAASESAITALSRKDQP